ncbi:GNAT family N-acetyltransferase [Alkalithermobacter paradoxus]|uniref:Acetyltransferase YpeA n=1 Tax=Alkalithermobacter paradoxus TaxID=29349 RepID=A0A1V4I5A5_9FIRM|nr:acetyltransferase YpeA [[Clostridium] thermoalcaliphilum]
MKKYILKNKDELVIQKANKSDALYIIDYLNKVACESDFLTFGEGEMNITLEAEEAFIEDCLKSDNKLFIVAKLNNKIVGVATFMAGAKPRIRHMGELGVSVLKEYWGIGIGNCLMDYLLNWAKETNIIKKVNLRVREDNHSAIKLYEKLGFKKEGIVSRELKIDDKFYSVVLMGLEID